MSNIKLKTFLDAIGRTILGEYVSVDETTLKVKNPVVLNISADQSNRMSVQLLPLFFREFLADKNEDIVFSYLKTNITETNDPTLDFRLQAQYSQLFGQNNIFVPPNAGGIAEAAQKSDKVVKLFDN